MPARHQDSDSLAGRRRWTIATVLGLGVLVSYFDRVNLSVSHAALIVTFGISNVTFGYLAAAYNWTYAMCQLPMGLILDRYGVKRVGLVGTTLWSIASFAAAITPNVSGFFAARLLLGVGEAPLFPGNSKAVGLWFPESERNFATAIFDSAAKFASAIGVPLIGLLLIRIGWRWSFVATGVISVAYLLLFKHVYHDPDDDPMVSATEKLYIAGKAPALVNSLSPEKASLGYLMRQPVVIGMALGFGSYNYVFYMLITWLPSYLSAVLHIDLMRSFLYTGVPWLFATACDLGAGLGSDALIRRGWDAGKVRKRFLVVGTCFGLGILGAADAHTPVSALFWISLSIGGLAAASPIGWAVPSMIAPRGRVGAVGGIINFSNQVSGIAAPIVTGYVIAITKSYNWAFGVCGIYLVVGITSYILLLGRLQRIPAEPEMRLAD